MASLTKHPKSRFFTACYTNSQGKQVKRSTKETNRNSAYTIALEWEALEQKLRQGTITTVQIHKVLNDLSQKATGDTIQLPSVEHFLNEFLKGKEIRGAAAGTVERYRNTVKMFLISLGDNSQMPINGLTPTHVQNFLDKRLENGAAPKTVIVDIKTLSTAFNYAEARMLILKNPVKAIELPKNVSSEREIFTHEQVIQILNALPLFRKEKSDEFIYDWKTLILLGYYTGARLSDCVSFKFKNIDLSKGIIVYLQQKTGKEVRVPIHRDLYAHICDLINVSDVRGDDEIEQEERFLCGSLADKGTGGKHGLSETFLKILKKANIESKNIQGKGKKKFNCLSFHSLRHSFNTNLFNNGISQEVRMKLTGHSSVAMNTRYTHQDLAPVQKAVHGLRSLSPEDN
jgi:site-specific recombinase XerD